MDIIRDENARCENIAERVEILKQALESMKQYIPKEFDAASDTELAELYEG